MPDMNRTRMIMVEGPNGAGKTTFGFRPRIYASPELAMRGLLRHGLRNRRA